MKLENLKYTDSGNFFLLAGPCVIEGEYMAMDIAELPSKRSVSY